MKDQTDAQLLRAYAENRSEPAFAELVRRHLDMVHSAAVRMVCDSHLAQDVTQAVFVALAKNAPQLTDHAVLSGWLHRTARNIAAQTVRTDVRRRVREQEAAAMNELLSAESNAPWEIIAPHLDAALGELNDADRDALMLRYFEKKSALEMAVLLGISDEAAQKRVSRAVERLREFFASRGIAVGAGALVVVITANAVQAAPAGLVAAISAAALTGAAISTPAIIAATKTIAMTTLQKTIVTAAVAMLAGAGIYEAHQATQSYDQNQALERRQASLTEQVQQLQGQLRDATNRLARSWAENTLPKSQSNDLELLQLRGEVAQLKSAGSDPMAAAAKSWLIKANKLRQRMQDTPSARIPELQYLTDDDWLSVAKGKLDTENDYRRALGELRHEGENKFAGNFLQPALADYSKDNGGNFPTDLAQLQPYFSSPVDDALLQRWEIMPKSAVPNVGVGDSIITQVAPVDDLTDQRMAIGSRGYGSMDWLTTETQDTLKPVYQAFTQANGESWSHFDLSQLLPYATTPAQQTAVNQLIAQKALRN